MHLYVFMWIVPFPKMLKETIEGVKEVKSMQLKPKSLTPCNCCHASNYQVLTSYKLKCAFIYTSYMHHIDLHWAEKKRESCWRSASTSLMRWQVSSGWIDCLSWYLLHAECIVCNVQTELRVMWRNSEPKWRGLPTWEASILLLCGKYFFVQYRHIFVEVWRPFIS